MTTLHESRADSHRGTGNEAFIIEITSVMSRRLVARARQVFSHPQLSMALQGTLAVAVGLAVMTWPDASLAAMVLVFALYAAADGLLSILGSLAERNGLSLVQGLISLAVAAAALTWPDQSALVLVYVVAVWVITMALFRVRHAIASGSAGLVKALLVLLALPSVAGGLSALLSPGAGAHSVLIDVAIFQIINGVSIVGLAMRARPRSDATAVEPAPHVSPDVRA